jgi:hypothetical protein
VRGDDLRGWDIHHVPRRGRPEPLAVVLLFVVAFCWMWPLVVGYVGYALGAGEWWMWAWMAGHLVWTLTGVVLEVRQVRREDRVHNATLPRPEVKV